MAIASTGIDRRMIPRDPNLSAMFPAKGEARLDPRKNEVTQPPISELDQPCELDGGPAQIYDRKRRVIARHSLERSNHALERLQQRMFGNPRCRHPAKGWNRCMHRLPFVSAVHVQSREVSRASSNPTAMAMPIAAIG